jgi:[ribosomal protein S5]-alanine N-acetyltransferase
MLAERVGFEPTCRLRDKTLSRRPRYDHFGTSPQRQVYAVRTIDYTWGMRSERLTFSPVSPTTIDDLHALVQDDHVRRYLMDGDALPREWTEERVRDSVNLFARRGVGLWLAHSGATADLVGFCGFLEVPSVHSEPQLVYAMFERFTGGGLGTEMARAAIAEARRHQGFATIIASADEANVASIRILEKLGFKRVGTCPGRLGDVFVMVLDASSA